MWRLIYPLRYFSLINNEKRHLDFWPTAVLSLVIAAPYLFLPGTNFFGQDGFLDKLIALTTALTGFYVAALVAAATFAHPDLDKTILVGSIAIEVKNAEGKPEKQLLTRREFACMVFGYLAFATLFASLASAIAVSTSGASVERFSNFPWVGPIFKHDVWIWLVRATTFGFSMLIAHIAVVTSLGLYYLMDRLYRQEPRVTARKRERGPT